jgi:hypothetical protein
LDGGGVDGRDGVRFENLSGSVLGISGFTEFESSFVLLIFSHEEILNACCPANDEHEQASRDGVERAAVAYFSLVEAASNEVDNIV